MHSSSIPHTDMKSFSTTVTNMKSIYMLTLKASSFRHAHKNKINFDPCTEKVNFGPYTKTKSTSAPHTRPSQFPPQHWSRVIFHPHSKNKSILRAARHENQSNFDPYYKPIHFRPPPKTKSVLIPTLTSSQLPPPPLKSRLFRPPTQQRVISMPTLKPCHFRAVTLCVLYIPVHVLVIQQYA